MTRLPTVLLTTAMLVWARAAPADEPWPETSDSEASWESPVEWESEASSSPPGVVRPVEPPLPSYAGPFQLRGVIPKNSVKLDSTMGFYHQGTDARETVVFASSQIQLARSLALLARWGFDDNRVSSADASRTGVVNPTLGLLFGLPLGRHFRWAISTTVGFPIASGGGDTPDPNEVVLQRQGSLTRSAFDNTSFSLNDMGFPTGMSFAYLGSGLTVQSDVTLTPSVRVKGSRSQPDASKLNSTFGLFLGYFLFSTFSLGIEGRYQRYLSTPSSVARDPSLRDNLTLGGGFRVHVLLAEAIWTRPGLCYSQGVYGAVEQQSFRMIQLDLPVNF